MNGWAVAGLAVLAILLLLLGSRVRVAFAMSTSTQPRVKIKVWCFSWEPGHSQSRSSARRKKSTPSPRQEPAPKPKDVAAQISQAGALLRTAFSQLIACGKHVRLDRLKAQAVVAGEDAAAVALDYGRACAVVYPAWGFLEAWMTANPKRYNVQLRCDFEQTESFFSIQAQASIRIVFLLAALACLGIGYIKQQMEDEYE